MFENPLKKTPGSPAEARETEQRREAAPMTKHQNHERPATLAMIGPTIHIKGELSGGEGLVIQGHMEGTINLKQNNLIIGQAGKITATVHAHTVTIEGTLKGDVFGEERVIVKKTGNVLGNITAPQVSLEEGAKFKGSMDMDSKRTGPSMSQNDTGSASVVKLDPLAGNEKATFKQSGDVK